MSKQICVTINNRHFDLSLDAEFAEFLQQTMQKDFNIEGNNDIKTILEAYVRKNYELYHNEKKMKEMLKKLEE
jgi:hypothetical protein